MGEKLNNKPKIMLHVRSRNQISGPNVANNIIYNSFLNDNFNFGFLEHNPPKGIKNNLTIIKHLMAQIKTFNPDIVHVSGLLRSGFEAVVAARLCRKKVLLTIRGSSTDAIVFDKKFMYGKIIEPLTLRLSHKVYAVCDAMANREYIRKHTKERLIGTIHNSAPTIDKDTIAHFGLREKFNIGKETVVVAIVGRMIYDKGVTFVADAIKKIKKRDIVFVFIGDGPYLSELSDILSDEMLDNRVLMLGKQNNVLSILKECDIFLFATLHENLSNALLEACSMGLAVIATNVGGNPEVIRDAYNGVLIPPTDSDSIEMAVTLLAGDMTLREKYGKNALKTMEEDFSQTKLLKRLEQEYKELCD